MNSKRTQAGTDQAVAAFSRRTHVTEAYLVNSGPSRITVERPADVPTTFVRVPAAFLTYLLGREESAAWSAPE